MFKNAATKIAHNSTIPSIGGNKDLRPLQYLITAEKSVLVSYVMFYYIFEVHYDFIRSGYRDLARTSQGLPKPFEDGVWAKERILGCVMLSFSERSFIFFMSGHAERINHYLGPFLRCIGSVCDSRTIGT